MTLPILELNGNGELRPSQLAVESFAELGRSEPSGVYTVARTYHGDQAVMLDAHLRRLEESARLEGIPVEVDRLAVRAGLRALLARAGYAEARFRITLPQQQPAPILLAAEPLAEATVALRRDGVAAATVHITRANPRAKTNAWIAARERAARQLPPGVYEGIVVNERDQLLEGFSSNFYAVMDGELRTSEDHMLYGIARRIVLEVARDLMPVRLQPIQRSQVPDLSEALISSSGRGVVPVVRLDDRPVGGGTPGAVTRALQAAYDDWVERHLEPI